MTSILAMEYGGFVYGSYGVVLGAIGAYTWRVLRRARQLSDRIDDADKYWH